MSRKISVVCPTWNSEKHIERALRSIFYQKDKPDEVVVVDDGSTDNTVPILKEWRRRFEISGIDFLIVEETHHGPGMSRNIGIQRSSHQWIAFLDSDDYWVPEKIRTVRRVIVANPESNIVLHWERYERLSGKIQTLEHGKTYQNNVPLKRQLYRSNFFSTSAITCQRELLIRHRCFDATLPNAQDYDLWLRMSDNLRLSIIREVLGSYVEQQESITSRPYYRRYISLCRVASRHWRKGGSFQLAFKILRLTFSEQWLVTTVNFLLKVKRHSI